MTEMGQFLTWAEVWEAGDGRGGWNRGLQGFNKLTISEAEARYKENRKSLVRQMIRDGILDTCTPESRDYIERGA